MKVLEGDSDRSNGEGDTDSANPVEDARPPVDDKDERVLDVSEKRWEVSLLEDHRSRSLEMEDPEVRGLYIYHNVFHLVPQSIGRLQGLRKLKFFANEIDVFPPQVGELSDLESLQIKVSSPALSGFPLRKLNVLKELELCRVPQGPLGFSVLSEIVALTRLTKLSICHFSIKYLPPEIGLLKKLENLDLSFNKLKNLPNEIADLSFLKSLRVSNNKLVDLPPGLSCLWRLENLDLSNNRLASLGSLRLTSMHNLQTLNLQYNKLLNCCQVPSWICCNLEGNVKDTIMDDTMAAQRICETRSCSGCTSTSISSTLSSEAALSAGRHATRRMKKVWKRRDYLHQKARQERSHFSRKGRSEHHHKKVMTEMTAKRNACKLSVTGEDEDNQLHCASKSSSNVDNTSGALDDQIGDESVVTDNKVNGDDCSCDVSDLAGLDKDCDLGNSVEHDPSDRILKEIDQDDESSSEASRITHKSKRISDKDLSNPKPSKCQRPFDGSLSISCKYSTESFCSIDDHLPDGFYDAGRDRPFMPLQNYEHVLSLDSREVILVDRERDEELDAIAMSAQNLVSSLKRSRHLTEEEDCASTTLHRASILALFVSDCFGGSDRSISVLRTRRAVIGLKNQKPFVCTCSAGNKCDDRGTHNQIYNIEDHYRLIDLCENSLRSIKKARKSNVIPIGTLRLGVCRHRAVLMKYLCDRADPPIPCELVRGYLDFMPHAWNSIIVRRGNSWVRMVVDACHPTDIREECDPEYFCRYIPLSRLHVPSTAENFAMLGWSFPSYLCSETEKTPSGSVIQCKFGTLVAAAKVRNLEVYGASEEEIKIFEYTCLGEVRMLGALRKHKNIVQIYGHQISSKWIPPADGKGEHRFLQSIIAMEYINGSSLKSYLDKLIKDGEKHVPIDIALHIAKGVACALSEVHSKHIIHRDIKSENVLIDLDAVSSDRSPVVKLCDFDRAVPLHSFLHTCCISHRGIPPPDICVGTPRWMAPEVIQAMHRRNLYGLEVDIWSYGCLLLEMLTLKVPYEGLSETELLNHLQMGQRPSLSPELEKLASSDGPTIPGADEGSAVPDVNSDSLRLLVELFNLCTKRDPVDRPTAKQVYEMLSSVPTPESLS
ncbi:Phosphoenolpyruvate carboxylase kinase 1 [Acorus gramineus]|uniref:Phosphoenolpyruvate carboxylase kinase 1 n=1 Tax=Acorus gramineus TaxID=55184 RepID=A0AAV9B335_ACOGR|nr:Phosphoenolpyruvate carboxylase kinase 1 [Acorus gramineus]